MDSFTAARDQDAWAVIRGFKYQIDLTIIRWLKLADSELLELESGEDIDLVACALSESGDESVVRKLEQVKLRSRSLTLRSSCALEALVNAFKQRMTNPGLNLQFCYTTNASIGSERRSPFPGNTNGIRLWSRLREGLLTTDETSSALEQLRSFFESVSKPRTLKAADWRAFVAYIVGATDEAMLEFINRFEWSCGQLESSDLEIEVRRQISMEAKSSGELRSSEVYDRLFVYVLALLARPGTKRLTAVLLADQLSKPTLSDADHHLLQRVKLRINTLESRVGNMEKDIQSLEDGFSGLAEQVGGYVSTFDSAGAVSVAPPPKVVQLAERTNTVASMAQYFDSHTWIALNGAADTGKTQLAALISGSRDECYWVKFNTGMPLRPPIVLLQESLAVVSEGYATPSAVAYADACRSLHPGTVFVLDDLPLDDGLIERLAWLASGCHAAGLKIISTSHYPLPMRLKLLLPDESLTETLVPPLTDDEAKEVLLLHGAQAARLKVEDIQFLNGLAAGNPLLVTLAARYLKEKSWQIGSDELKSLMRGDHALGIADDVLVRISKSLDSAQREFLYRLTIPTGPIRDRIAVGLAKIEPPIDRPKECLATLVGAWVQRPAKQMVTVNPVFRAIADGCVVAETARECHLAVGKGIIAERMSLWDARMAIDHFTSAEALDLAGSLLVSLLVELKGRPPAHEHEALLATWASAPFPDGMSLSVQLMIRTLQSWIFPRYGWSDDFELSDLDTLMNLATQREARTAFHVAAVAALFLSHRDFSRSARYYVQAMRLLRSANVDDNDLILPRGKQPAELLWNCITNIDSKSKLDEWKHAFDKLNVSERKIVIRSKDAELGCSVLANKIISSEAAKEVTQRNWTAVLDVTRSLQAWAEQHRWGHLQACSLQSEINLYAEHVGQLDDCKQNVQAFLQRADIAGEDKASVSGMYGKMLAGKNRDNEALGWLQDALAHPPSQESHSWMMTLAAAAKCTDDRSRRVELAAEAARVARSNRSIPPLELAKVLGELSVAQLLGESTREASLRIYPTWAELAEIILGFDNRNENWKAIFAVFAHVMGFLMHLARGEDAPVEAWDGSKAVAPYMSIFLSSHPDLAARFQPESVPAMMWFQSLYSWAADDGKLADFWLSKASEELDCLPESHLTRLVRLDFVPRLLNADDFERSTQYAYAGVETVVALQEERNRLGVSGPPIPYDTPITELTSKLSEEGRGTALAATIYGAFVPSMLRIVRVAIKRREDAIQFARQLRAICKLRSRSGDNESIWKSAESIFGAVCDESSEREMWDLGAAFYESGQQDLSALVYLALPFQDKPASSFVGQLAAIEKLYAWYPPGRGIHSELLLPFVEEYWVDAFSRQRFLFRLPKLIEQSLANAMQDPPQNRVAAILRALLPAFDIPSELTQVPAWLRQHALSHDG